MEIQVYSLPPIETNAYLLLDKELGEAVLFDVPLDAWQEIEPKLKEAGCELKGVYLTHGHWDHILDVPGFNERGMPVYAHRDDVDLIENPSRMASFLVPGLTLEPGKADHLLEDGQELKILGETVEVRHVPGHSPGSILFYFPGLKMAISGDTVFAGGIGRTDFPGCSSAQLLDSIKDKILTLPDDTIICPGHGPTSTVGAEKVSNPFLRRLT